MSLVVSIQCSEGIVLAADSASTMLYGIEPRWVWQHAKKVSHIRDYNVGVLSFGLGAIGPRNIQSLIYEFENEDLAKPNSKRDEDGKPIVDAKGKKVYPYEIEQVAEALIKFLEKKYKAEYASANAVQPLGLIIAGYSQGKFRPKEYRFRIPLDDSNSLDDYEVNYGEAGVGILFEGMPDAAHRLLHGFDPVLLQALSKLDLTQDQKAILRDELVDSGLSNLEFRRPGKQYLETLEKAMSEKTTPKDRFKYWQLFLRYNVLLDGMPLQDAIDFATWLIEVTIGRYRFASRWPFVGGDIDIAVITHSDFTWIKRKAWHSYDKEPSNKQFLGGAK